MTYYYESPSATTTKHIDEEPLVPSMKVSEWLITLLLTCIPVVNIIMLIIWSLDTKGNPNRRNIAIAVLIFMAAMLVLSGFYIGQITGWFFKFLNLM